MGSVGSNLDTDLNALAPEHAPLVVDGGRLLEGYPDGCVGHGVSIGELVAEGVVIGSDDSPITCTFDDEPGNGALPPGITIDPVTCELLGDIAPDQRYGTHVWITTLYQGDRVAHLPHCARQVKPLDGAYLVTLLMDGEEATFKPGLAQMNGGVAAFGDALPNPKIKVERTCTSPACFYKFYFAYSALTAEAEVSANPNWKLGEGIDFDGFFHAVNFSEPNIEADIPDAARRHWVVNFSFDYCISSVEANCDTKEKAIPYGRTNLEFGVIVRP